LWEVGGNFGKVGHRFLSILGLLIEPRVKGNILADKAAQVSTSPCDLEIKVWECDWSGFQFVLWHNKNALCWFRVVSKIGANLLKLTEKVANFSKLTARSGIIRIPRLFHCRKFDLE
jgi:hypothetical protein